MGDGILNDSGDLAASCWSPAIQIIPAWRAATIAWLKRQRRLKLTRSRLLTYFSDG